MNISAFEIEPWQKSHPSYETSAFALTPAPEYATSEVLLSSLYRTIGVASVSEGKVPQKGTELESRVNRKAPPDGAALSGNDLQLLLHSVLEAPKRPNQSAKRFLQVTPLVGETSVFSGSARLRGNSWRGGALVRRMVWLGSSDRQMARETWSGLFAALHVDANDDVFAAFLSEELAAWTDIKFGPIVMPSDEEVACLPSGELDGFASPARQFVHDLSAVIAAKPLMTRRQWISLLEALIRVGTVAHVAWLCEVHKRIWTRLVAALDGRSDVDDVRESIYPRELHYLTYGRTASSELQDRAAVYLDARLGINALLWLLAEKGKPFSSTLSSARDVAKLCEEAFSVRAYRQHLYGLIATLAERERRVLLCKKGIGSNMREFSYYVLQQRGQSANPVLRGYDQGYVLRKRSSAQSAQLICSPGPVSVLTLVHCSLAGLAGPRSVRRLSQHMRSYGIVVNDRDIPHNDLGQQLRMLGLVLDSPDAESGMLLVPPFPKQIV